jgi:hypothetical protein
VLPSNGKVTELPRQPDVERLYRRIRNLLRQYSVRGLVQTALPTIWSDQRKATALDRLRGRPWHVLLLVKWALRDNKVPLERASGVPQKFMDYLRETLWTHAGAFNSRRPNVFSMIRSYMAVQIEYQRHRHYSFLRWPALIAEMPANSILRRQFREVLGMEPATFIDLTVALKGAISNSQTGISASYFDPIRGSHSEGIAAIERLFVRSLSELRLELATDPVPPRETELLEFPYFIRYPILNLNGRYLFWDEVVAEKAFERAVHLRMSSLTSEYSKRFGLAFEEYVVDLLKEARLSPIGDEEFTRLFGPSKNAEAVVPLGPAANLIVEAKMGLFPDHVLLKDDPRFLYEKFAPLRTAMRQGHDVSKTIRRAANVDSSLGSAEEDFLVIVTSRDLLVSGGPMLKHLIEPQTTLDYYDAESALPLRNTFIMDIQGFETFCMAVKEARVDPVALLKSAAKDNEHVGHGSMFFEQWLTPEQHPKDLPQVMRSALESAYERLAGALKGVPPR